MPSLRDKNMVVIGGSRGVGRRIVEVGIRNGARVLAVARQEGPLRQLAQQVSGAETLALDATEEGAPSKVFDVLQPDILVLCGARFRLPRRYTSRAGRSSLSTGRPTSKSHFTSSRQRCRGLCPRAARLY